MRNIRFIHQKGKPRVRALVLASLLIISGWIYLLVNTVPVGHADAPKANLDHPVSTPTPTLTSEQQQIIDYINEVFGKEAPKAFQLLYGNAKCPGENGSLNPYALNNNETWGGLGKDYGIFQINNKWQGVTNEAFLYDWRINIDIAHNIYVRDHHSFKLWTSGRCQGL